MAIARRDVGTVAHAIGRVWEKHWLPLGKKKVAK